MESTVELTVKEKTLRGIVHRPIQSGSTAVPVVILFHGFTGSKIDDKFLFVRLARLLEKQGIGCVRFDFSGSGESDGNFSEMTFENEVDEGKAILDYTHTLDWVDQQHIGLLGFSMGGAVATQVAKERPESINRMCLWSPAGNMNEKASLYFEQCESLENGNVDLDGLELGRGFYDDLKHRDLYAGVGAFQKPVLILHGALDESVPLQVGEKYAAIYKIVSLRPIQGANHTFSKLKWRDDLYQQTVAFFEQG